MHPTRAGAAYDAGARRAQAGQRFQQSRLSRAAGPNDRDQLTRLDHQRHRPQDRLFAAYDLANPVSRQPTGHRALRRGHDRRHGRDGGRACRHGRRRHHHGHRRGLRRDSRGRGLRAYHWLRVVVVGSVGRVTGGSTEGPAGRMTAGGAGGLPGRTTGGISDGTVADAGGRPAGGPG
ncbi:hypothetical protein [Fodinicola feengrottensis]|uniref:hypothetical protein n=1 Tax=Fodinicola feengrottensis TaxID=435914 RepID=UPI002442DEDD|nr:hypothetical protein [Fodinicola feengrottensis]